LAWSRTSWTSSANPDDGLALCRQLGPIDLATSCYVAVGEEATVLYPSMERRAALCMKVEPRYLEACRFGAGLGARRPDALPADDLDLNRLADLADRLAGRVPRTSSELHRPRAPSPWC
jgi:hypothetical protein